MLSGQIVQQLDKTFYQMQTIARLFAIDPANRELLDTRGLTYLEQLKKYWVLDEQLKVISSYFSDYHPAIYLSGDSLLAREDTRFLDNKKILEKEGDGRFSGLNFSFWKYTDEFTSVNGRTEGISYYHKIGALSDSPLDILVIRLEVSKETILGIFHAGENSGPAAYYLLDNDREIALADDGAPKADFRLFRELPESVEINGLRYHLFYNPIRTNDMLLAAAIPESYYNGVLLKHQFLYLTLILLLFAAFFAVMIFTMNNLVRIENEKKRSELAALQSQIKPHFIYNTLDSINWMALEKGNIDVSKALVHLANFMRKSLAVDSESVTVNDEIDHVRDYVAIMNSKSDCKITLEEDIEEQVRKVQTVKFLLQPLVENAVIHGIYDAKKGGGIIHISGRMKTGRHPEDTVEITVSDDGAGFEPASSSGGLGLYNVEYRLRLFYGHGSGLTIKSRSGAGTSVIIRWRQN
jgi:two-component sensor histidine kinase